MITTLLESQTILPLIFAGLMGFSILLYVILDGFDLGVGIVSWKANDTEKDRMIASIGPFWDANETWLVMAIGILLVAFPLAHGAILTALYLPVALMLLGLMLRGVAFEFRVKAPVIQKSLWNMLFFGGSLLTALTQGWMLGFYIMGFENTPASHLFAILTAICLTLGYAFIGACWLIVKMENELQEKAVKWARIGFWGVVAGLFAVSITTPFLSDRLWDKWFSQPYIFLLSPLPIMTLVTLVMLWIILRKIPNETDRFSTLPFVLAILLFVFGFIGLAYSFYPYVVPEVMTIYEAASASESLLVILFGAIIVMPIIGGYTVLSYFIFRGKAQDLRYD